MFNSKHLKQYIPKPRLPLLILLAAVGIFIWLQSTREAPVPLQATHRVPLIAVQTVTKAAATPTFRMFGQVETPNKVVLTAGVEADISEVKVLEGNAVQRGQELIVLDDTDAVLDLQQRQAELSEIEASLELEKIALEANQAALETEQSLLALARKAVTRVSQLAQSQVGSVAAVDQAMQNQHRQSLAVIQRQRSVNEFVARQQQWQSRRDSAMAAVARAERERQRTTVTAPFSGRITAVLVTAGGRTKRDTQLIRLYDDSQLELRAQIPIGYASLLRHAIASALPIKATMMDSAREIDLVLHRLSANVASGQGGMDAFFRARSGQLPVLGETVEIELRLPPIENAVVIPADALYGQNRVYRVRNRVLEAKAVRRLGQFHEAGGQHMLILSGDDFADGEQILNSRLPQAVSGLQVQVMP